MSLHAAAQHLAAHGRGKDTQLVHMSPGEVKSLQDLAKAHGGSLTTNPHTGLPEASFLESALPVAAGFALNAAVPGLGAAMGGFAIPALVGGASYLASGSLTKGLMAGLGAYGGAGLGAGLAGAGTSEAGANISQAAEAKAEEAAAAEMARQEGIKQAALSSPTPQNLEAITRMNAVGQDAAIQSARDFATDSYLPTAAQKAALNNPTMTGLTSLGTESGRSAFMDKVGGGVGLTKYGLAAAAPMIGEMMQRPGLTPLQTSSTPNPVYTYNRGTATPMPSPDQSGVEQTYFPDAGYVRTAAAGGSISSYAEGGPAIQGNPSHGPVEQMSIANSIGQNTGFPQAGINRGAYATPWQTPISRNMLEGAADIGVNPISGEMNFAQGGLSDLGGYSDGGRLLRGPGDGVSDSIPAVIGKKQPARLADGEFVVPARIVSEIGNGSTEAGARKLYAMMDRVQKARAKTTGKGRVAKNTNAERYLPA